MAMRIFVRFWEPAPSFFEMLGFNRFSVKNLLKGGRVSALRSERIITYALANVGA